MLARSHQVSHERKWVPCLRRCHAWELMNSLPQKFTYDSHACGSRSFVYSLVNGLICITLSSLAWLFTLFYQLKTHFSSSSTSCWFSCETFDRFFPCILISQDRINPISTLFLYPKTYCIASTFHVSIKHQHTRFSHFSSIFWHQSSSIIPSILRPLP